MSQRIKSFQDAFRGIRILITSQKNARFHFVASIVVILLGFILKISNMEWAAIILSIAIVWLAEGLNTAIELLCDVHTLEIDPRIRDIKDIAAGAVLIASGLAALIGTIVFLPKIF